MSIERIKQEAAKADQRIKELSGAGTPVVEEKSEDAVEAAQPEVKQQSDQGVVADAATEDHTPAEPVASRDDAALWEQRYRSLQGMIQARDRQIEQLHTLIAGMQNSVPEAKQEQSTPSKGQKLLTSQDEDKFGEDLVDMARRAAREEQSEYVQRLEAQLNALNDRLQGVAQSTAVTAQDRFEQHLTTAAPTWRTLNDDPAFVSWLQASPARQRVFVEAVRAQEVDDVAYFFNEYATKNTPDQPAAQPARSIDPRLEKQVAPGKSKSTPTPSAAGTEKKQWTRSEIADLFAHGKKRYTSEEFEKLQKDAFAAQREGRVDFAR